MSTAEHPHPSYVTIWAWLVMLVGVGLALVVMPLSKTVATSLIFSVAAVKATLVVRHYMHLREQPPALYVIVTIPVLLAIGFALTLLPDIGFRP